MLLLSIREALISSRSYLFSEICRRIAVIVGLMKVVILAGGLGIRMGQATDSRPKPMVEVGDKPVIWHIMKHFATYGHKEFVICAGHKSEVIKSYFLNYIPLVLDFTISLGDKDSVVFHGDHQEKDWTVTVVDTGHDTPTGGRLRRVMGHLGSNPFFVTYGDGIADVNLKSLVDLHTSAGRLGTVTVTRQRSRFGLVELGPEKSVQKFSEKPETHELVNIGFFVFEPGVKNLLSDDSNLEAGVLQRLSEDGQLSAYFHSGFWQPMDTFKEKLHLVGLWGGNPPWKTW